MGVSKDGVQQGDPVILQGPVGTTLSKAEDAAHVSGDHGFVALVVRKDTATALAGTDGDYAVLEIDANGRLHVVESGVDLQTAGADSESNTANLKRVQNRPALFDGTNWHRQRGSLEGSLLASAARTTATPSPDQIAHNHRGILFVMLNVTVASGTGGLIVQIQGKDPVSGNYFKLHADPAAIIATGLKVYALGLGIGAAAGDVLGAFNIALPRTWRVNVAVGDASSYTYSVGYSLGM